MTVMIGVVLEDCSVTVDQIWGKAIFAGGRRDGGEGVGEVWVYDMESGVYSKAPLEEECFSGRTFPGVAADNRGRHVYIYGGMDDSGALLSDAWKVNLYTGRCTNLLNDWDLSDPANPVYTDTLSPGKVVYGLAAHGERVYVAHAGIIGTKKRIGIYNASNGFLGLLGEVETSKIPVAVRVQGNTLFAAGLNLINALKCFAGIKCLPADVVEVFDITDPQTPSKLTDITFNEAEVFFGSPRGMKMVIQGENGFEIFRPEVQQ